MIYKNLWHWTWDVQCLVLWTRSRFVRLPPFSIFYIIPRFLGYWTKPSRWLCPISLLVTSPKCFGPFANQSLKSCTDHFPLLFCHLWYRNAVRPRICFRTSDVSHFVAAVNIIVTSSPLSPVVSVWIFINFRRAYSFASYGFWCRVQLDPNSIYNSLLLDSIWVEYVTIDNKFVAKGRGQLLEYFFRPPVLRRSGYPETSMNHIAEIEMTFSLYMVKIPSFFRGFLEEL